MVRAPTVSGDRPGEPHEDHLQLSLDNWLPNLSGEPARAVHVRMDPFFPQNSPAQRQLVQTNIRVYDDAAKP
jgi:hypothetical protein